MSGLAIPGRVNIQVEGAPGPNAFPISMAMGHPQQGVKFITLGGISTRLLVASMLGGSVPVDDNWERTCFSLADRLIEFDRRTTTASGTHTN